MAKKKATFRSTSRRLALEPRLLFDGAAAIAGADALDNHHQQEGQKDNAAHATSPAGENHAGRNTPAATTSFDFVEEQGGLSPDNAATLVVIDSRIPDYASLLDQLPAHAVVRVVDAQESGLDAIHAALVQGQFQAVHILSHGTPGSFAIGTDTINNETLPRQADALAGWATQLTADADILLYGCDIAQGEAGRLFINEVARLTSADVAASTDATGSANKGGNWVLESATGSIEAGVLAFSAYGGVLAAPTVTDTAPADEPFSVGENTPKVVGNHITVTGTGADSLTVTASVTEGTLSASTFTGNAAAVQDWLASLSYTYTGTSQTGDSDTLTLSIVNNTNAGTTVFTRSITIAPENDAPVMTPPASGAGRLSVAEGSNAAFAPGAGTAGSPVTQINLGLTDLDNTQAQIILKLTTLPGQGVLKLNGNELTVGSTFAVSDIANLSYHHNGSQVLSTTTDTFQITVDDGVGGLLTLQTVTVDITPVNQAPSVGGDIVLIEGETGVKLVGENIPVIGGSRGNLTIADPDDTAGTHTVQITGLPAHGVLKYNGVAVSNGQTIANANLSLFTYDHDGSETTSDSFKIKVTDAGGGQGAGAAITTADQTVNLTIIPNNDDPVWHASTQPDGTNSFGPVIFGPDAGGSAPSNTHTLPITTAMLHVVDAESGPERLTYTLTSIPSGGYLTHSGYPGQYLPVGFTFTQKEIDDGKISFVNTTGNSHSTDFKFTVMDGDRRLFESGRDGGIYADEAAATLLTEHTFKIEYQGTATGTGHGGSPPTAAPIPTIDNNLGLTDAQIAENQYFTLNDSYLKASSTGSTPEQITYRLLTLPSNGSIVLNGTALGLLGSFTQADINAGNVKFQHDGSEDFTASFTFDVSNGSQITAAQTFNIDVKPQNDTPTASNGDEIKLTEGATIVINSGGKTHITLSDSDNDTSDKITGYALDNVLSFRVTALPTHGTLKLDGTNVTVNQVISKADLDSSKLTYEHNGSENYTDAFTIVPIDDANVASTSNNTDANANPPSGDPTNQISEGAPTLIQISVNPLNDALTYVNKAEPGYDGKPALKEGTEFTIWGATYTGGTYGTGSGVATPDAGKDHYLVYQDSDNTSEQRQYRVTTATKYGTLTANGRVMGAGSVFTQAELDAGQVKYKHGGGEQFDDKFEYVVSDGDYSANQSTVSDATAAAQGTAITPSEYRIKLERANDKPTISTSHTGLFVVDSSVTAKTLPAITLGDKDIADGIQAGESDFVQITVQFLESDGTTPYTNGVLQFESGYNPASQGDGVTVTNAAGDSTLVFTGKLADVQAALAKVQARTGGADADASNLKIKVTIDDRLGGGGANGGTINDDGSAPNDTFNTASITINVAASDRNDLPVVTAVDQTVLEDVRTQLTGISYADPDAFGSASNNTLTLTVGSGKLYFHASNNTITGGATVSAGAVGTSTVTLQGTKAQLDAALANLYYTTATDYNGDDSLQITVSDGNNYGLDGTDGNPADASKTVAIAITPVNDAPTLTGSIASGALKPITGSGYTFQAGELDFNDAKDISNGGGGFTSAVDNYTVTLNVSSGTITLGSLAGLTSNSGNGTSTITLTGTRAAIQALITTPSNNVVFIQGSGNVDQNVTFTMTVNDLGNGGTGISGTGGDLTATRSFTLIPTSQNDAPSITGLDATKAYTENTTITIDADVNLVDPELDLYPNWNGAILTIERDGGANAEDQFGVTGSGNTGVNFSGSNIRIGTTVVGTFTNTGGKLDITFNTNATNTRVDQVIQAITYTNLSDKPPASIQLNYSINDQNKHAGDATQGTGQDQGAGGPLTGTASITLNITKTVDSPVLSAPGLNAQFTENGSAVTVDNTLTLTDADDDNIHSATVAITGNFLAGDTLAVNVGSTGITATYDSGTGVLTLSGAASKADYQQVLQSLTYVTDSDDPTTNTTRPTRTLTYTVNDNGSDGAGAAGANPGTTTRTVTVIPVNDTPVLGGAGSTYTFTENGSAITLEPGAWTLTDVDDTQMVEAKVWISSGFKTGDMLDASSLPGGWTKNYNAATGELTLSGAATDIANVLTALKTVTYVSTSDDPGNADRTISWQVKDANSDAASNGQLNTNTVTTTVHVTPVNDPPVATPNTNTVTEDAGAPVTGNVKTDGTADSDPDNVMSTVPVTSITATTAGGSATTVADNAGAGTVVTGKYGTLTIKPDGSYSYALDNSNPDVNALQDSQTLNEVFSYTITDPGNLTASSTLTITINGKTDGAPQIVPVDGNTGATGEASVNESGLSGGSEAATSKETTTGTLTVTAPDGLKEVTIGGTTFTVAQLQALSVGNPSAVIDTGEGELRITGITINTGPNGAPKDASIGYTYTLKAAQTHTGATATESTDVVTLAVKDVNDVTGSGNLTIQIVDDVPTASNDTNSITKGAATVTGNAFTNDSIGADGAAVGGPVTAITGGTLGSALAGSYGSITLNADGSYSYALDNSNLAVTALQSGQTLTDTFTYTITDKDGDASTATVTITINGYTPPPPNQVPVAVDDIVTLDEDVPYTGTLAGNDTPSPDGGNVWSKTTDPQHGTVVVNPGGTFTYTPDPDYNGTDSFTYTITDANGDKSTATVTLTVRPVNDVPVATPDSTTTPKDKPVSGNLASNDMPSPDGGNVWSKTTDPSHGTVVVNPDGTYTYTPNEGFTGTDSFTYTVRDVDGDTSTATVTVTVTPPVVEPPVVEPPVVEPPVVEPPVVEPPVVEPPVPPVEPPYIEPPTVPQSPYSPPATLVDSPQGLVTGDVAHMPGVFNDFGDQHRIVRMQIPLHPIIYVTREVADRQAEQAMLQTLGTDMGLHEPGQQRATSIGLGLGQDPTLYVQHAVRDAQREGSLWERLARKIKGNLSPLAPEPDLNPASDAGIPESLQGTQRPGQGDAPQAAPDMPEAPATEETAQAEHLLMQRWAQQEAAQDKPTHGVQPIAGSFQQQLQVQARKLPSRVS